MDGVILYILLFVLSIVVVTTVLLLIVSAITRKAKGIPKEKSSQKGAGKRFLFLCLAIISFVAFMTGLVFTGYGLAVPPETKTVVGQCYECDGLGVVINKNGFAVTCDICNGFGSNAAEVAETAYVPIGIILIVAGAVGYVIGIVKIKKSRKNQQSAPVDFNKPLSPYALQVKLYDTSYDTGSRCFAKMEYVFTDANTREQLGRGTQFQVVTLNVDKPTRIRCHVGRGFKDAYLDYMPRENAKYRVIPNIYNGLRFEETDFF